ncbi:hypothetical protein ACXFAU_29305 (plasmid) [Paenibacillus glucanolyticus]
MNDNQRTVTLPTIPKKVADAIEWFRNEKHEDIEGIVCLVQTSRSYCDHTSTLRSIPFDTLLSALVNGYVVEKSAEELAYESIRAEYRYYCGDPYGRGARHGIIYTLHTLGIKIEGVNA